MSTSFPLLVALLINLSLGLSLNPAEFTQTQQKGKGDPETELPDGYKALKHPDAQVRYNAVALLGRIGAPAKFAMPQLKTMLDDPSIAVRVKVAETLWKVDNTPSRILLPVLLDAAKHKDGAIRAAAFAVLGQIGPQAKSAVPLLQKALKDEDFNVRFQAVRTAGSIGSAAKPLIPDLFILLKEDDTGFLEATVAVSLSEIGSRAVPQLADALMDSSPNVRRGAAYALSLIGEKGYEAVPLLTKALNDEEPMVREYSARALGKIGKQAESSVDALRECLNDRDLQVAVRAAESLWLLKKDKSVVNRLAAIFESGQASAVRALAADAIATIGSSAESALPTLKKGLSDSDANVREAACAAISSMGNSAANAVPELSKLLDDKQLSVRIQAAAALWKIDSQPRKAAQDALLDGLKDDLPSNRKAATEALALMGKHAKFAVAELSKLSHDEDEAVRRSAVNALQRINFGPTK